MVDPPNPYLPPEHEGPDGPGVEDPRPPELWYSIIAYTLTGLMIVLLVVGLVVGVFG